MLTSGQVTLGSTEALGRHDILPHVWKSISSSIVEDELKVVVFCDGTISKFGRARFFTFAFVFDLWYRKVDSDDLLKTILGDRKSVMDSHAGDRIMFSDSERSSLPETCI